MKIDQLSVIVPTVNAVSELELAITSLKKNSDIQIEIIIVVDPDRSSGRVSKEILAICKKQGLTPVVNEVNHGPYGNWNIGASHATSDWLVFATDDQYFAPHWDTMLLREWQPKRLVAGRLVEPGIIPVWRTNIKKDFGTTPAEFREKDFVAWCAKQPETGFVTDGFFIPMLIARGDFNALGKYPEKGQFGTSTAESNDINFVTSAMKKGYKFGTAGNSFSYHFQASSWKKKTLKPRIAAVVLTHNEEKDLAKCLRSLKWATNIYVIDSGSTDKTVAIARKHRVKVVKHSFTDFASQRNFAISQVSDFDWVLMLDADEEVPAELSAELLSFAKDIYLDGVMIPRRNHIFGKWIEHSDWYPDLRLVYFRPRIVKYQGDVHERVVFTRGNGETATAQSAIIHHNYDTVSEFVQKNLVEYPAQYATVLANNGDKFIVTDLVVKPTAEFMRRYFLCEGYKDGLYGFVLSLLMAAQSLISYIYLWEKQGKKEDLTRVEMKEIITSLHNKGKELRYWLTSISVDSSQGAVKLFHRARRKVLKVVEGL